MPMEKMTWGLTCFDQFSNIQASVVPPLSDWCQPLSIFSKKISEIVRESFNSYLYMWGGGNMGYNCV